MTTSAWSQRILTPLWTVNHGQSTVGYYGSFSLTSNRLSNSFIRSIYSESMLSSEVRMNEWDRLHEDRNRVGGHYATGVQGALRLNDSLALNFSVTDEAFGEGVFTQDAFGLAFMGNKPYAGDTAWFSDTYLRFARFQKFGIGLSYRSSSQTQYGLVLSFVNGESAAYANVYSGYLYTSTLGDTLVASAAARGYVSDTGNVGFMRHNGGGAMIDFHLAQPFEFLGQSWQAEVMVMNLGAVQWHPSSDHYTLDTTTVFNGIQISDIETAEGQINRFDLQDSVYALFAERGVNRTVNQVFPGWMQMELRHRIDTGFTGGMGVTFRPESFAAPYVYLLPGYQFHERFGMELELGYGGYGRFQSGLAVWYGRERFGLRARLANLEALLVPASFGGITLAGGLQYYFR